MGFPGSGKTTVFNALTGLSAETGYAASRGKTHLGVVKVPDARVEALAELTGGDVPLDYFMGGPKNGNRDVRKIENYLPQLGSARDLDPPLHRLLSEGRASESSFDTNPSPVGAFLHSTTR